MWAKIDFDENKAYTLHITDEAQLDGLPNTAIAAAAQNAKEQEKEGWKNV